VTLASQTPSLSIKYARFPHSPQQLSSQTQRCRAIGSWSGSPQIEFEVNLVVADLATVAAVSWIAVRRRQTVIGGAVLRT